MNRISRIVSFAAGCALAIAIAAPARAATANVDQRAVKFGTTLPATCWTGDIFFKTDAAAGSNLYACVALNTWVVQGGSTVVNGGDATGFAETRTSNTVMTTSLIAATANVKFGTVVQSIGAGGTVTLGTSSCSGGGLIWKSVTPSGVLEIDSNTNVNLANVTVSGFVKNSNTATGTPNGNFPLYRLSCGNSGADQWDSNMILDLRATYAQKNVTGGTFVIPTEGATGTTSLDIDPARLQGSDPNLLTAGTVSGTGATLCTDANGGATTSGCSGGGGGAALSAVTAAAGFNTIANGDNPQIWNWFPTTSGRVGMTFGETTAATSAGTPYLLQMKTLAGSTAIPLNIANSLTGSQTLPSLLITPTWNTTGLPTALKVNVADTASDASSLLMDLQVGGVSQFKVNKGGIAIAGNGFLATAMTASGSFSGPGNQFRLASTGVFVGPIPIALSPTDAFTTTDLTICRQGAGVLELGTGTTCNALGTLLSANVTLSGQLNIAQQTPATSSAACTANQFAFDTNFIYVCTATNTWKRVAVSTW